MLQLRLPFDAVVQFADMGGDVWRRRGSLFAMDDSFGANIGVTGCYWLP